MVSKVQKMYEKAMQLSEDEREVLSLMLTNAVRCNESHDGWASPEIEQAWKVEIERREQLDAEGKMKWIPGEEVMRITTLPIPRAATCRHTLCATWPTSMCM